MYCKHCNYHSFDHARECPKCGADWQDVRKLLHLDWLMPNDGSWLNASKPKPRIYAHRALAELESDTKTKAALDEIETTGVAQSEELNVHLSIPAPKKQSEPTPQKPTRPLPKGTYNFIPELAEMLDKDIPVPEAQNLATPRKPDTKPQGLDTKRPELDAGLPGLNTKTPRLDTKRPLANTNTALAPPLKPVVQTEQHNSVRPVSNPLLDTPVATPKNIPSPAPDENKDILTLLIEEAKDAPRATTKKP